MSSYAYPIATTFTDSLYDPIVLYDSISGNAQITPLCTGHLKNGGNLEFHFVSALSAPEESVLNGIIANYHYVCPFPKNNFISAIITAPDVSETSYYVVGQATYPGSSQTGAIFSIDVIGYMDPGAMSYDFIAIHKETNTIIVEKNYTNTQSQRNVIGETELSNIPEDLSTLEFSVKINKNGNATKYVHINQINLWIS